MHSEVPGDCGCGHGRRIHAGYTRGCHLCGCRAFRQTKGALAEVTVLSPRARTSTRATPNAARLVTIPTMRMLTHSTTIVCRLSEHVLCDGCDRPGPTVYAAGGDTVAEARDAASVEGWASDAAADRDVCPACIARGVRASHDRM